jgi:hypothetical protein
MKGGITCYVCQRAMVRGQPIVQLKCECPDSVLHRQCAVDWIESGNGACPSCNRDPLSLQKRQDALKRRLPKGVLHTVIGSIYLPWRESALYQMLFAVNNRKFGWQRQNTSALYLLVYLGLIISVLICILATKTRPIEGGGGMEEEIFGLIDVKTVSDHVEKIFIERKD